MTRKLKMVIGRLLNLPLYLITRVTPRDPGLWVCGAWFGGQFADNPRYLAEHILANRPDIRVVWLAGTDEALQSARQAGLEACKTFSWRGYWATARAAAGMICTSSWDINHYVRPHVVVNAWHGNPLKKVGLDDDKRVISRSYQMLERAIPAFRPGSYPVLVSSEPERLVMQRSFAQPRSRVHVTGYPRNDVLERRPVRSEGLKIIYMPTHRGQGKGELVPMLRSAAPEIESRLEALGATMYVKLHFYHAHELLSLGSDRIVPVTEWGSFDTHRFLNDMDVLVTDYSSILFDWLLTDRPLVLFPFDLERYLRDDRAFNWDYESISAGPQCRSWPDVLSSLEQVARGDEDPWAPKREEVRSRFHAWTDGGASARVIDLMEQMVNDRRNQS